jgi:histidinol dehydrogenase
MTDSDAVTLTRYLPHDAAPLRRGGPWVSDDAEVAAVVTGIVDGVRHRGDAALFEYTKAYDAVDLNAVGVRVAPPVVEDAYAQVGEDEVAALRRLNARLERVARARLNAYHAVYEEPGLTITVRAAPIPSVGCYVPGGRAAYPSTLLMTATPARVAGVPRTVICSPPTHRGEIHPLILVAADVSGVDEVYRVGGAQAIAALAYGTETIQPVAKIVGPGGGYVTTAKRLVARDVAIDLPAGPSEVVVLADASADPRIVAMDLISQTEHAPDNVAGLVTVSGEVAAQVEAWLNKLLPQVARQEVVARALSQHGFVVVCDTLDEAVAIVNAYAPEHLEILTQNPSTLAAQVTSAGIVLLGPYTPASASDYAYGTNHVLPTGGFGHLYSGLSVLDYLRWMNVVECSKDRLAALSGMVRTLSASEGLPNHYRAVEERLRHD